MKNNEVGEDYIYEGRRFPWILYYDPHREDTIVEIGGGKFGSHDILTKTQDPSGEVIALSDKGKLYLKDGKVCYSNTELKFHVKLEKKACSPDVDYQRSKIFEIKAFMEIARLKDSLKVPDYKFGGDIKQDFVFFRDSAAVSDDWVPNYKKRFYDWLKNQ